MMVRQVISTHARAHRAQQQRPERLPTITVRAEAPVPASSSLRIETLHDVQPIVKQARMLAAHGIRIVVRVVVASDDHPGLGPGNLRMLRAALPTALISLDPADTSYPPFRIRQLIAAARAAGHASQVMLRWDLAGAQIINDLMGVTDVGIWNDPRIAAPTDPDAETERLRAAGVRGTISLQRR